MTRSCCYIYDAYVLHGGTLSLHSPFLTVGLYLITCQGLFGLVTSMSVLACQVFPHYKDSQYWWASLNERRMSINDNELA